jgi:hypothetical protein
MLLFYHCGVLLAASLTFFPVFDLWASSGEVSRVNGGTALARNGSPGPVRGQPYQLLRPVQTAVLLAGVVEVR